MKISTTFSSIPLFPMKKVVNMPWPKKTLPAQIAPAEIKEAIHLSAQHGQLQLLGLRGGKTVSTAKFQRNLDESIPLHWK
jgi:hypothetical protein